MKNILTPFDGHSHLSKCLGEGIYICELCGVVLNGPKSLAYLVEEVNDDARSCFSDLYLGGAWHPDWPPMAMDGSVRA